LDRPQQSNVLPDPSDLSDPAESARGPTTNHNIQPITFTQQCRKQLQQQRS